MRHLFEWSVQCGRVAGVPVRLHVSFLGYIAFQILYPLITPRAGQSQTAWALSCAAVAALFVACALLHELGHIAAAWRVGGQASEILLWPLGGLTTVDYPPRPRYEALIALAGPSVNLMLLLASASLLLAFGYWPPVRLLAPVQSLDGVTVGDGVVFWFGVFFTVNLMFTVFNVLPGLPLDGARLVHAYFWATGTYNDATTRVVQISRVTAVGLLVVGLYMGFRGDVVLQAVLLLVGFFVLIASEQELQRVSGMQEFASSELGWHAQEGIAVDLEDQQGAPLPRARRKFWWERWWERWQRARRERARRMLEQEERELDRLLEKVQKYGKESLTSSELRFLKRVSRRYRSRTQSG